jgi:hypothetical protein
MGPLIYFYNNPCLVNIFLYTFDYYNNFGCTREWIECTETRSNRVKRQEDKKEDSFENEICKDKDAGEWFRLVAGEGDNCRDVIQCTSSGLQAIRCPAGLYFDIDKQTCDWKDSVNNCKLKNKERKVKPQLFTEEPLCPDGSLACGDGICIERGLFCNGEKDCADGSDENVCGESLDFYNASIILMDLNLLKHFNRSIDSKHEILKS